MNESEETKVDAPTDEDVARLIADSTKVNFDHAIGQLNGKRMVLLPHQHHTSEYCYQLISLLIGSQNLINGGDDELDYIKEKTDTLCRILQAMSHDAELAQNEDRKVETKDDNS